MFRLQFTTLVEAPLTVAFDVGRALGRPWSGSLQEVHSERPFRDVYSAGPGRGWRELTHSRRFTPTAAGTLVEERVDADAALPAGLAWLADRLVLRPRLRRAMRAHLDAYAAAAARRALDVVQVVGAALLRESTVLVAQRAGGRFDGRWEFPGGKVEPGEEQRAALVREIREELGIEIEVGGFVGEVPLDAGIGGGAPGASTLRVWAARSWEGEPIAREHARLRWVAAAELEALDWIPADRPLLPAVRALLAP